MPEDVHRAGLAAEPARELLEHVGRPLEGVEVAPGGIGVVAGVLDVGGERRGHRHAEGLGVDRHVDPEPVQHVGELPMEGGHGEAVGQLEAPFVVGGPGAEAVVDQVELDLEASRPGRHPAGGEPASRHEQG